MLKTTIEGDVESHGGRVSVGTAVRCAISAIETKRCSAPGLPKWSPTLVLTELVPA